MVAIAIVCALLGAFFLALGTFFQGTSVKASHGSGGVSIKGIVKMFKQPRWVVGMVCMLLGMGLNLAALAMAPLMIVQPLGSLAVVITTLINTKAIGGKLNNSALLGIAACLLGCFAFVMGAVRITHEHDISVEQETRTLHILIVLFLIVAAIMIFLRKWIPPFSYVLAAGILFGFVAVLTRITLTQYFDGNGLGWRNINFIALGSLIVASLFGSWIVQNAYSKQPPDMVSAGLTVIDPIVGVTIGILLLGEVQLPVNVPIAIGMVIAAGVAITGIIMLAKHHPERQLEKERAREAEDQAAQDRLDAETPANSKS